MFCFSLFNPNHSRFVSPNPKRKAVLLIFAIICLSPTAYAANGITGTTPHGALANPTPFPVLNQKQNVKSPKQYLFKVAANFDQELADIQRKLAALGYEVGEIDGVSGSTTRNAIKFFQNDNLLPPTGRLSEKGGRLLSELYEISFGEQTEGKQDAAIKHVSPTADVPVEKATKILKRLGYLTDADDGILNAVLKFQSDTALNKTGEIDMPTYERLVDAEDYFFNVLVPYWKEQNTQIERVEKIRELVLSQPSLMTKYLMNQSEIIDADLNKFQNAFTEFIKPAIPFIGCYNTSESVVGFYNVVQHFWILFWIDQNDTITKARVFNGIQADGTGEDISWLGYYARGTSIIESVKKSFDFQMDGFRTLFEGDACHDLQKNAGNRFSTFSGMKFLVDKNAISSKIDPKILNYITTRTKISESVEDDYGLTLVAAIEAKADKDFDLLTFHTLEIDRGLIVAQFWRVKNGLAELLARGAVDLMYEGDNANTNQRK